MPVAAIPNEGTEFQKARDEVARGKALSAAGRYREARAVFSAIPTDLSDPSLLADVARELGMCAASLGELASARNELSRAVSLADVAGDDRRRALALTETLGIVGDSVIDLEEAGRLIDQTRAAVQRAGSPPELAARLAVAIGEVELRRGRFEAATAAFRDALASYRAHGPGNEIQIADVLNNAAGAHTHLGDHVTALKTFEEARTVAEHAVGSNHPLVAAILASTVESLHETGRRDDAFAAARRSIAIYEHAFGPRHAHVASAIDNLAILHMSEGNLDEAIPLFERSRTTLEQALGEAHPEVGTSYLNIASAYKHAGRLDAAATAYARAIAIWETALGRDHVDLARPLRGLGRLELERGAPDRAVPLLERALAIRMASKADPDFLADTQMLLARALVSQDRGRALELAGLARTHYATTEDSGSRVAEIDAWIASSSARRRRRQ